MMPNTHTITHTHTHTHTCTHTHTHTHTHTQSHTHAHTHTHNHTHTHTHTHNTLFVARTSPYNRVLLGSSRPPAREPKLYDRARYNFWWFEMELRKASSIQIDGLIFCVMPIQLVQYLSVQVDLCPANKITTGQR